MTDPRSASEPAPRDPSPPASERRSGATLAWLWGIAAAAAAGYLFRSLALPLLLAALLAYLLNPLVAWTQGFGIRRSVAVTGLFVGIGVLLIGGGALVVPRFRAEGLALAANLPSLTARLERGIDGATREVGEAYPALRRFLPTRREEGWLERLIEERVGGAAELLGHAGTIVFVVILVPLFAFFLLRDSGRMVASLMDRLHTAHVETSVAVWCEIDGIIGRYLRGLALDGIIVGILAALGLWLIGVPYPLLLGAFTALVNPVPYLGTVLSVTMASVVSLAQAQGLGTVGWILVLYGVIRLLDDVLIGVVTIGGSVHLHPMLVLASVIAGEHALGLLGMVLAVPLATVLKETGRLLLEHRRALARPHLPAAGTPSAAPHYVC